MSWTNTSFEDFNSLLHNSELVEEPVPVEVFIHDKKYMSIKVVSELQQQIIEVMSQIFLPHTLIELYGEEKGKKIWDTTVNELVLLCGKGCPLAGTRVWCPETGYEKIEDISKGTIVDGLNGLGISNRSQKMGNGRALKITTQKGLSIDVYEGHKFYGTKVPKFGRAFTKINPQNKYEWLSARDVEIGDLLAIQLGWTEPLYPIKLDNDLALWFGYMLGDGTFPNEEGGSIKLTNETKEVYTDWIRIVNKYDCEVVREESGWGCPRWRIVGGTKNHPTFFAKLIRQFDLCNHGNGKRWTDKFLSLKTEALALIIKGIIATDGSISINEKSKSAKIEIDLTSKEIIYGIQQSLFRLGVPCSVTKKGYKKEPHHKDVWRLNITSWAAARTLLLLTGQITGKEDRSKIIINTPVKWQIGTVSNGLTTFIQDKIVSIEELGDQDYYDINIWPHNAYLAEGFYNHNSGKDWCNRLSFAYTIYKLHCLKNPLEYYGKSNGTYIDLLNIAVNADQARNVFFDPLRNIMKLSPWFQSVGFEIRKSEIEFNERPIRLFSGNSEAESWEGLDLLLVVLDEIAAFKVNSELKGENRNRLSADALYKMSKLSVISRFPSVGKTSLISFPRHRKDYIMQRYAESANEEGVFRLKAPTWEMNPLITREMLEPEFKRNPIDSESRFACNPPEALGAYFRDPQRVRSCFKGTPYTGENGEVLLREDLDLFPVDENGRFKDWFKAIDGYPRFVHVDLAKGVRDRAALCMTHSPGTRKVLVSNDTYENLPVIKMDLIKYWDAIPGQEIDFADIRQFIILLSKRFPLGLVTFDQWQSTEFIQNLNKRGINSDNHSVRLNDYDNLSTCFYDGRFRGYFNKLLVEDELLELILINGKKVEHQTGAHDDAAQALAGSVAMTCLHMDLDQELEIDILGLDDDWNEYETQEANEDDLMLDGRRQRRTNLYSEDFEENKEEEIPDTEFSFRTI